MPPRGPETADRSLAWRDKEAILTASQESDALNPGVKLRPYQILAAILLGLATSGCALHRGPAIPPGEALTPDARREAIARAVVWTPTDIPSLDFKKDLPISGAFPPREWVTCDYMPRKLSGHSPKFACLLAPGDEVRVKYGERNGELIGEVLSTRLFWALGFPADRMYPVRVHCRGCPQDPWKQRGAPKRDGVVEFANAAIERKLPGRLMQTRHDSGWKWPELDIIGAEAGPQARTQRDALKLLAAFVQHTDSKASQQQLLCPEEELEETGCRRPVLMVHDLGLTFGRASLINRDKLGAANFDRWAGTPVWQDAGRCVARLGRSLTGTLRSPRISEAGRAFLAGLLEQLSDQQLHDLFEVAGVERRARDASKHGEPASVDEWVNVFKRKRSELVDHRCP